MDPSSDNDKSSQEEFTPDKKEEKKKSKTKQKKPPKAKAPKKPKDKQKDKDKDKGKQKQNDREKEKSKEKDKSKEKEKKEAKEVKKKKPSKSKQKGGNIEKDLQVVHQYLQKQNRPYNLLNIFDNLHGTIKKPSLEIILEKLVENEVLSCKEFGKNKVYFLNQSKFQVNEEVIEKLNTQLTEAREVSSELQAKYKSLTDQHKKLMALRTTDEIKNDVEETGKEIEWLEIKHQKLMLGLESKVEEGKVIQAEKEQEKLRKQLKKLRNIKKQALKTWAEILEKKPVQVADIMGVDF